MEPRRPGFFARLWLAIWLPWKILFSRDLALQVERAALAPPPGELPPPTPPSAEDAALQLLSLLQREGRFVDFLEEEITGFSDAEVGAAARVVHEGCRRVLRENFSLAPVRAESEGAPLVVEAGFDASEIRLTGRVAGSPPFRGRLAHPGWKVTGVHLPQVTGARELHVIAPAEVEL